MADNIPSQPSWAKIKEELKTGDTEKIAKLKQIVDCYVEQSAKRLYLKRSALSSILATTLGDIHLKLKDEVDDPFVLFQRQAVFDYASKHGLTIYSDFNEIRPNDSVAVTLTYKSKGKILTACNTFRMFEKQKEGWLVSPTIWEQDEAQFKSHKRIEKITKKNFIVGVRQAVPPIMKKPQIFYFLNFDN